jgi:hypothetical protein
MWHFSVPKCHMGEECLQVSKCHNLIDSPLTPYKWYGTHKCKFLIFVLVVLKTINFHFAAKCEKEQINNSSVFRAYQLKTNLIFAILLSLI